MNDEINYTVSSGNVFEDIGIPDADLHLVKAKLVNQISRAVWMKQLTQIQVAEIMGIDQPKVSDLLRGKFRGYSVDRLLRFLNALGHDVKIVVSEGQHNEDVKPTLEVVTA
jgi:predicted XRE-type DNA-binding protein